MRPCSPPEITLTDFFDLVAREQQAAQRAAHQGLDVAALVAAGAHPLHDPLGERRRRSAKSAAWSWGRRRAAFSAHLTVPPWGPGRPGPGRPAAQQRGLADAVLADDGDLVAGVDAGREGLDDRGFGS
jgi:hypothetical protein